MRTGSHFSVWLTHPGGQQEEVQLTTLPENKQANKCPGRGV